MIFFVLNRYLYHYQIATDTYTTVRANNYMINKIKKSLENFTGYWIYKKKHLPIGTDLNIDLKRLKLKDSQIVFDVGANIGQTALVYSELFKYADIYSFEPVKLTFEELTKNTKRLNKVKSFHFGFGQKNEKVDIILNPNPICTANSLNSAIMNTDGVKETLTIKTIDHFCSSKKINEIDFLKIAP